MWNKKTSSLLLTGVSNLLLLSRAKASYFWLNVDRNAGTFEVTFSEAAGIASSAIHELEDSISETFSLFAMNLDDSHRHHDSNHDWGRGDHDHKDGEGHRTGDHGNEGGSKTGGYKGQGNKRGPAHVIQGWTLEDNRISGDLPDELKEQLRASQSTSIIVSGHLDTGASEDGTMESLQHHFYSDQLLNKNIPLKIPAHETMKEKPFFVELVGCDEEIVATVHGVSSRIGSLRNAPVEVCVYELGGQEIGCQNANFQDTERLTDDTGIARINTKIGVSTTIFAKVEATFPSEDGTGPGHAKYATVSDNYEPNCSY
mmetsp:Transcript_27281/g.58383  ORF Transcript_27281/g.58383 Transcript_27281/m.58383 type:complete len:314 (-) Transcript_27281:168-1109(-)|eukprot:CAMPEP_0201125706 /NCGR_PEP_ID=MMETSP0850-20130426/22616_1 /ASSEMBLY_ACC=CAM_ASM_000622 /TAXON_ID=183588 /ORGANISM="Pseudo-nitzschia fraudulenta, Strain WWA7" /LENGTH=313 /DNA_ID=CAMNT_0047393831 /DNA_START=96 /DNA_END=1037 /DNA_ORIENTATION=-